MECPGPRFDLAAGPAENPGPGHYGEGSKGVAEILQEKLSWSAGAFAPIVCVLTPSAG